MRLKELRKSRKLTQQNVADFLGIPYKTYQNYEREVREADSTVLCKLADLYGVTLDALYGRQASAQANTSPLAQEELEILESFRNLNAQGKSELMNYAAYLLSQDRFQKKEMPDNSNRLQGIA